MKRADNKSHCPINFTIEIFGDTWSLLIVRDMLSLGKKTFGEFLDSEERIGPSVLAERLVHLEKKGIISKRPDSTDKRKMLYTLTEAGLDTIPIIYEIARWGSMASPNPQAPVSWFRSLEYDKDHVIKLWREAAESGSSFFIGPDSVINKLDIRDV
jgi:DNA-binding HxlR family transcriptional regulator